MLRPADQRHRVTDAEINQPRFFASGVVHDLVITDSIMPGMDGVEATRAIAQGLDYVGVSPVLAHLKHTGRVRFEWGNALDLPYASDTFDASTVGSP